MRLSTACCGTFLCLLACKDVRRSVDRDGDAGTNSQNGNSGSGNTGPVCVAGDTQECVGPGACAGAQECLADRSGWSECDCGAGVGNAGNGGTNVGGTSAGGTSNGGNAQGGTANGGAGGNLSAGGTAQGGSGGVPNTAGAGGSGEEGPFQQPMITNDMVQYAGNPPHSLGGYHVSSVEFYGPTGGGLIRYETNAGATILNVAILSDGQGGWTVDLTLAEGNPDEPEFIRGMYKETEVAQSSQPLPVQQSCVDFTALEMVAGGAIVADLQCGLTQINTDTPQPATLSGQLFAEWTRSP